MLPSNIEDIVSKSLQEVRLNSRHHLSMTKRWEIYNSFGLRQSSKYWDRDRSMYLLTLSKASLMLNHLSILAAKKVIQKWEGADFFKANEVGNYLRQLPQEMLEVAEGVLMGKIDVEYAEGKAHTDFYYDEIGLDEETCRDVYSVFDSSRQALSQTLYGMDKRPQFEVALKALHAFAGVDQNEPGLWRDLKLVGMLGIEYKDAENWSSERVKRLENFKPFYLDRQKSLEFWEWWLTEAIPQAWELTNSTYEES